MATLLRQHRHFAGLTIEQLSERSWVSVRAISNMERGESLGPQHKTIQALSDALVLTDDERRVVMGAARAGRRRVFAPPPSALSMPRDVSDFVGRETELATLHQVARGAVGEADQTGWAHVVALSGEPGMGKTSLAVRAAATVSHLFPDGQFFLNLHGLDEHRVEPSAVLGRLLRVLDPAVGPLPDDVDSRSALLRGVLARHRVLLVLDNAADEPQLRPLLPAGGRSLVIITSRRKLSGLEGIFRMRLGPLSAQAAAELLSTVAGDRPDVDPASLRELANVVGYLPLALRIVANRLATRPDWNPARLVRHLDDEERRLHVLSAGDLAIALTFALSYDHLSDAARQLFRRCALVPGHGADLEMAQALAGRSVAETEDALDELVETGLLQTGFSGRYRLHNLLWIFAADRLKAEESSLERQRAADRLHSWLKPSRCKTRVQWSCTTASGRADSGAHGDPVRHHSGPTLCP